MNTHEDKLIGGYEDCHPVNQRKLELLPCPFCGSKALLCEDEDEWVHCDNEDCELRMGMYQINWWNTRITESTLREQADRYIERYLAECDSHMTTKGNLIAAHNQLDTIRAALNEVCATLEKYRGQLANDGKSGYAEQFLHSIRDLNHA